MTEETVGAPVEQETPGTASPGGEAPGAPSSDGMSFEALSAAFDEIGKDDKAETVFAEEPEEGKAEEAPEDGAEENDDQSLTDKDEHQEDQEAQPETPAAIDRPQSWSPENDALWKSLPPDAQKMIAQRETDAQSQISRMGRDLSAYQPLGELLGQHRQTFERNGLDPVQGVKALLEAQQMLEMDPVGGLAAIAGRYGLSRVQLAQALTGRQPGADGKSATGPVDPALMQLSSQVQRLQQSLAERDRNERTLREQQERAEQAKTDQEVQKWAADKPHFGQVRQTMATLLLDAAQRGENLSLDDAYDRAVYADPSIRQAVLTEKQQQEAARRKAEAARKASDAKRAGAVNAGSSRPARPAPNGRWDDFDALSDTFDRIAQAG